MVNTAGKMPREQHQSDSELSATGASPPTSVVYETGYDVDLVDGVIPDNLSCSLCEKVLRKPHQSTCGHRFCANCLSSVLRNSSTPCCPVDKIPITKEESFHDVFAEREVMSLQVHCPSKRSSSGCQWTGELRSVQEHERVCEFMPRPCPNGCHQLITERERDEHLRYHCANRLSPCQHCQTPVALNLHAQHLTTCPQVPLACPNGCSSRAILRCQMQDHTSICPKQIVKCFYHPFGCDFEGPRCNLPGHHEVNMGYHLQICSQSAQKNQTIVNQLSRQNSMLTEKFSALEEKLSQLQLLVESNVLGTSSLHAGRSSSPLGGAESMPTAHSQGQLETLRQLTIMHDQRLASAERSLALHDVQLSEINIRQDLQEMKTTNGVLVWKIANFSRHQQDAITGRTPSIYSQPFYTSPAGYKVCARLYPNGDGVGKGTHLSLFFVVMKGEFDTLLRWPFQQKVSLSLLDQNRVNPRDVVETFRPDPSSSSFQRPEQDMNVASGCPLFLPLSTLGKSSYLRDDTLYFRIIVHQQGLQAPDQL